MNRLFSASDKEINLSLLMKIYNDIREEGEIVYKDYCDLLPKGQLKLLRAIAKEDMVTKPYETDFMRRHNLTAVSSVKLAINTLTENGIVAKSQKASSSMTAICHYG